VGAYTNVSTGKEYSRKCVGFLAATKKLQPMIKMDRSESWRLLPSLSRAIGQSLIILCSLCIPPKRPHGLHSIDHPGFMQDVLLGRR
jgi:hypothetical protein